MTVTPVWFYAVRHVDDILKVLQGVLVSGRPAINGPDEDTYIPLLCACGRTGRVKSAFIILNVGGGDFLTMCAGCVTQLCASSRDRFWVGCTPTRPLSYNHILIRFEDDAGAWP